jgi:glycosyltransferase involved in cell wall biosynthesis
MEQTYLHNNCIEDIANGKKVLFITTKNVDYIRNTQEIEDLRQAAQSVEIIGCKDKSYISRLLKIYIKLLTMSVNSYDIVFIGFSPQLILPFFYFKFKRKLIVEDFFISLYDTIINDRKKFKPNSIVARIFLWLDKNTLGKAEKIIVDTIAHGNYFVEKLGAHKSKINVLYLKADLSIYYPRAITKPKEFNNKFVVLYFGSILPLQGVDTILQCIEKMKDVPWVVFQMIGPINDSDIKRYRELKNVNFIPWLSQEDLAEEIARADLCLAGHFNNTIDKASRTIPGKAYIYNSMEKPMILGDNPANRELFIEDNINNYFVEMGNPDKLKEKILDIMESKNFKED